MQWKTERPKRQTALMAAHGSGSGTWMTPLVEEHSWKHLNGLCQMTQFTVETEQKRQLPFFNVLIQKKRQLYQICTAEDPHGYSAIQRSKPVWSTEQVCTESLPEERTHNNCLMPTRPMDTHTGPQMEFLRSQVIPNRQTGDAKLSYILCKKISLIFCQLNVLNSRNAALQNTSSHVSITEVWCTHTRAYKNEMIYASTSGH